GARAPGRGLAHRQADASAAVQIGPSTEQLSATIQELSSPSSEVMAAVEQINRASQFQVTATQQSSSALAQIQESAPTAQDNGTPANERIQAVEAALQQGRATIEGLIAGVGSALKATRESEATLGRLVVAGRKIEKVVNAIALISVQTSMLAVSG